MSDNGARSVARAADIRSPLDWAAGPAAAMEPGAAAWTARTADSRAAVCPDPAGAHAPGTDAMPAAPASDDFVGGLFRAHAVTLIRFALLLVGDRSSAEDVVQDAFLGLHKSLPRLRDPSKAHAYLRTSVVNGCRSLQRSRRRARLGWVHHDPPVWSAESAAMADEERRAVLAAVAELPTRAREVLALRYYLDLPENEIAAALGISRGTVSSTASRALAALARELKEQQ